jgi:hypothetical protein
MRAQVRPRIVKEEELPELAKAAAAEVQQEAGAIKTVKAARVRIEYQQDGAPVEEDVYCVLLYTTIPMVRSTYWGPDKFFAVRAQKGKLDDCAKLYQTMAHSVRLNLAWFNKYVQLVQILIQAKISEIRAVGEFSRHLARTNDEISESMRKSWESRQASQDRVSKNFSQYMRGVDEYYNPLESRAVELPSGYRGAWANPLGEYIVSEDLSFNPNVGSNLTWQRLERRE